MTLAPPGARPAEFYAAFAFVPQSTEGPDGVDDILRRIAFYKAAAKCTGLAREAKNATEVWALREMRDLVMLAGPDSPLLNQAQELITDSAGRYQDSTRVKYEIQTREGTTSGSNLLELSKALIPCQHIERLDLHIDGRYMFGTRARPQLVKPDGVSVGYVNMTTKHSADMREIIRAAYTRNQPFTGEFTLADLTGEHYAAIDKRDEGEVYKGYMAFRTSRL